MSNPIKLTHDLNGKCDFARINERKRIEGVIIKMFHNHKGFGCEYDKALKEVINNIR